MPAPPTDAPSFEGQIVGEKYVVGRLLGRGGMGTVWAGTHLQLETPVAIKFVHPSLAARPDVRCRFEIEARAAASVGSVHAVQIYDHGTTPDGLPYIVMEYLEGESLATAVQGRGPIEPALLAKIVTHAARALSKAHRSGVVHRDLKPDNVFLATNVEHADDELPFTVKLVDFGIAKILDQPRVPRGLAGPTEPGSVIGTPNFMAPEQLTEAGDPDVLTDLWSLGATVFTAMTGRIPFPGEVLGDIVLKVCTGPMPVPSSVRPGLPEGFDLWFATACHRDRGQRFPSAEELAASLTRVCAPAIVGERRRGSGDPRDRGVDRRRPEPEDPISAELEALARQTPKSGLSRSSAWLAAAIVLLLMAGVGVAAWRSSRAEPPPPRALPG
ncbi:MAG: serine/threonine protein kinase [Myxococcales bacterium]|nr:serine/threonine protein kinase [Myxococcales bacterium]MBL0196309.1 serine/threonine protein kinase [Myxococcales bacterium]HQY61309.1 serine/threonine-protein kinase [Polyangiaceae bacterium]